MQFNSAFENGNMQEAQAVLLENEKKLTKKENSKVLYDLNFATTAFHLQQHQTSADFFKLADDYNEAYTTDYGYEALSLVTNPMVKPYRLEYFEAVMLHFYQALNFIMLNDYESAMVECRRMNLELNKQSDDFKNLEKPRYSQDAFGHYMMGILYETTGNHNDAFIAYRNAIEIYEGNYTLLFNTTAPSCLKQALIRSAYNVGFISEAKSYEKRYGIQYFKENDNKGRLITFVLEGLSPVKSERSINFTGVKGQGGVISFVSDDGVYDFPVFLNLCSPSERSSLSDIKSFRMTLPKYTNRSPLRRNDGSNHVIVDNAMHNIYIAENIEKIAHQSLQDRIWKELGSSILRVAIKYAMNQYATEKNEYVGLALKIANAITEKADTRNWQSLPACVKILDIPIEEGQHTVKYSSQGYQYQITVNVKAGATSFGLIKTL